MLTKETIVLFKLSAADNARTPKKILLSKFEEPNSAVYGMKKANATSTSARMMWKTLRTELF
jgi:hypothetical protein